MKLLLILVAFGAFACVTVWGATCTSTCYKRTCTRKWFRTRCKTISYRCTKYCVHGGWSTYRDLPPVPPCSVTCGRGTVRVTQYRTCTNPSPKNGGKPCQGSSRRVITRPCTKSPCPIHGGWSTYRDQLPIPPCSVTCGRGTVRVKQTRSCTNPRPQYGGKPCQGSSWRFFYRLCYKSSCPIHGGWSTYRDQQPIPPCSVTCGRGTVRVKQTRSCTNPRPQYGGKPCQGPSGRFFTRPCTKSPCPIHGGWSTYTDQQPIPPCSVTCGRGTVRVTQNRVCTNPRPQYGGKPCQGPSKRVFNRPCTKSPCPIAGGWSDWSVWETVTNCTMPCGGGELNQTRHRSCTNPAPQHGGKDCSGDTVGERTQSCNQQDCKVTCSDQVGNFLPAPDPQVYYVCVHAGSNGEIGVVAMRCAGALVWNQAAKTCVQEAVPTTTTTTTTTTTAATGCVDGWLSAVPGDCYSYTQCVHGNPMKRPCSPGLMFNETIQTCDFAWNVNC